MKDCKAKTLPTWGEQDWKLAYCDVTRKGQNDCPAKRETK